VERDRVVDDKNKCDKKKEREKKTESSRFVDGGGNGGARVTVVVDSFPGTSFPVWRVVGESLSRRITVVLVPVLVLLSTFGGLIVE